MKKKLDFKGGYLKVFYGLNVIFNISLSLILIICSLPIFLFISFLNKFFDGSPVFYKSLRLGRDKRLFFMYKFRTLIPDADITIGDNLIDPKMSSTHRLTTKIGKFLRDTRLDELPQLFNVLKGEMDFVGPRPERPEIYEKYCKDIKEYDKRFTIKPGLVGLSQLLTPHSSPKRIRTIIDNDLLKRKQNMICDVTITFYAFIILIKNLFYETSKLIWRKLLKQQILALYREKRSFQRLKVKRGRVLIRFGEGEEKALEEAPLIDINNEAIAILSNQNIINGDGLMLRMTIEYRKKFGVYKRKTAFCEGKVYNKIKINKNPHQYKYIITYSSISPLNYYKVQKYFLQESIL